MNGSRRRKRRKRKHGKRTGKNGTGPETAPAGINGRMVTVMMSDETKKQVILMSVGIVLHNLVLFLICLIWFRSARSS